MTETGGRLEALKDLLKRGELSTQDELRARLEKLDYSCTQSTISRDLRKLGAVKAIDPEGRTIYRLPEDEPAGAMADALSEMVRSIDHNASMIVIRTTVGSASLVARQLDVTKPAGILGTIAGDDTIFVAPSSKRSLPSTIQSIRDALNLGSSH